MNGLRYYQQDAYDSVFRELKTNRSTMVVAATGLGKTRLFTAIAKAWNGRVLVLAHRKELVDQAAESLKMHCQEAVEIEQGQLKSERARIVVGSVQSVCQQHRLDRIGRDGFSLVIVDEVHNYLAKTFRRVLDWFSEAKVLGVTATPDRTDGKAMGQIMDSVAYKMDIKDGIQSGYLVPLKIGRVRINSIDLRGVNKVRGDLHEGKLEKVMLESVGAVVQKTLELHPDRQGILFFPGVESAELAAQKINLIQPGSAIFIDAKTDKDERAQLVADFRAGKYQWFCNCSIAVEGFDAPKASLVAIACPTTSRKKYTQMVGRGARVIAECVAGIDGRGDAGERRAAIEWSEKSDCVILDFVGNSGKHSLVSPIDLLGGSYDEEARAEARKEMEELEDGEVADPEQILQRAKQRVEARLRALQSVEFLVQATVDYVDPFTCLGMDEKALNEKELSLGGPTKMSSNTRDMLERFGVDRSEIDKMGKVHGDKMLRTLFSRKRFKLCDYGQLKLLKQWGITTSKVSEKQAREAIGYLSECAYGKTKPVDAQHLRALATGRE